MKIINILLIADIFILVGGAWLLLVRPFGVDMTKGIMTITVGFSISIVLFLLKLRLCKMKEK